MVREDIFGILRTALQKGQNLQQTVQSLYNSGYPKNEVDEAVQIINNSGFQQPVARPILPSRPILPPRQLAPKGQTIQVSSYYPAQKLQQPVPSQGYYQPQQFFPPEIVQKVSNYAQKPKEKIGKMMIIIMVIMLFILLGILVTVFLFKEELTSFFNNL